jgi:hypothetical protein
MRFSDVITEKSQEHGKTAELQTGFQTIARLLIDAWTTRIIKSIRGITSYSRFPLHGIYDLAAGSVAETFEHGKHLRKLPEQLRVFIKYAAKRFMILRAEEQTDDTKSKYQTMGTYRSGGGGVQPIITLYFDKRDFDTNLEQMKVGNIWKIGNFLDSRRDTLIHELVHAYDDFMSSGKYTSGAKRQRRQYGAPPPTDEEKLAAHNSYLASPHEINARFGQTIANLNTHSYSTWREYVYGFKTEYYGWDLMSPEVKRRLLVRLAMVWTATQRQKQIDIKPFVQKLHNRLHETFADLWIAPAHGNIEIRDLDSLPSKSQAFVLDNVCRLADIFQRQVVTWDDLPILRGFGFIHNKGRNKDYSISQRIRRPAKTR